MDDVSAFSGKVLAGLLPYSEVADVNNGKWKFKKAAGVKWGKPKKGTFKGSFKVYALQGSGKGTKLKKYTVKVSGVVVDGVGYGLAVCKKPMMSCPVSIK